MISNKLSEQTSVHLLSTCRLSQDEGPIPRRHTPCENESGICIISNMLMGWRIDKSFCIIVLLACEFSCKLYWWPCLWFCIACTGSLESLGEFQEPPKLITDNHSNVADNCLRKVSRYTVHLQHNVPWAVLHCYSYLLGKFLYSCKSYELISSPPKQVGAAWNRYLSLKT